MKVAFFTAALVASALTICAQAGAETSGQAIVDAADAIAASNKAYVDALRRKDARAFADLFAMDAISMPPFSPIVRGRAAIEAGMRRAFQRINFGDGELRTIETHITGDDAFEIGTYKLSLVQDGDQETLAGRYLVVWRRIGGVWKIEAESSQADAPADPSPPPG